jgi:hypothetical protein
MTTTAPATDDDPHGPQVGDDEQLYRCIARIDSDPDRDMSIDRVTTGPLAGASG